VRRPHEETLVVLMQADFESAVVTAVRRAQLVGRQIIVSP
jgi:hypothetical protein